MLAFDAEAETIDCSLKASTSSYIAISSEATGCCKGIESCPV